MEVVRMSIFIKCLLTLSLIGLISAQSQWDWEQINDDNPGVEPSISVNPNSPDSCVMVWYEKATADKYVAYAAMRRNGSQWTIVNDGEVDAASGDVVTGDPVVKYLTNGSVYVSTISDGDLYLSYCDDIWAGTPTWTATAIGTEGGFDKPWLDGFYNPDSNIVYLYQPYVADDYDIYIADIEIDYDDTPPTLTSNLSLLDDEGQSDYASFWPTVTTNDNDSIYVFWGRHLDLSTWVGSNHYVDAMMIKKHFDQAWSTVSATKIIDSLYTSKLFPNDYGMTTMFFPAVDLSVEIGRLALAAPYYDTNNHRIKIYYSDNYGNSWTNYNLTGSTYEQVIPWVSFSSDSVLTVIYNQFESGKDTVDTYINFSYDGGASFDMDPIKINTEISDFDDQVVAIYYEYMGVSSAVDNAYCAWVIYEEDDNSDGSNVIFTNWINTVPATPSNFSVDTSGDNPVLSWDANSEIDLLNYKVKTRYWSRTEDTGWLVKTTTENTTWTDLGVDLPPIGIPDWCAYKVAASDYSGKTSTYTDSIKINGDVLNWPARQTEFVEGLVPESYRLGSAYPNPFNPVTTIQYDIPHDTYGTIQVFDMMGRKVIELLDGEINAGYHSVTWDASGYASGIYFVKLMTSKYSETKKVMLLK